MYAFAIPSMFIAGVPSSQELPGFLITAPLSVCVPTLFGALAVWIQNPKKKIQVNFGLIKSEEGHFHWVL